MAFIDFFFYVDICRQKTVQTCSLYNVRQLEDAPGLGQMMMYWHCSDLWSIYCRIFFLGYAFLKFRLKFYYCFLGSCIPVTVLIQSQTG